VTDFLIILILAVSGIIGYRLADGIDGFIDGHVKEPEESGTEKDADEFTEDGKQRHTHSCMSVFIRFKCKSHSRCF